MIAVFWLLLAALGFSLIGYGLLWAVLAALVGRRVPDKAAPQPLTATMLIAARNEEETIGEKLETVLAQEVAPHSLHVLVVSDGSEDATLARVRAVGDARVSCFQTPTHGGKAAALNAGLARIGSDIVVFSDANSMLEPGAVLALLAPFADPTVGGVCGRLMPDQGRRKGWIGRMEQWFWAYDNLLKWAEGRLGGAVSAQGTLYAMRREYLPAPVPPDVADDFYISVQAPANGRVLAFAPGAVAREVVTDRTGDEFRRRVRSTERGWRGLMKMSRLLNPWRYGLYSAQLFCHKVLRRLSAFVMPLLLLTNMAIAGDGWGYAALLAAQVMFYALGLGGLISRRVARLPGAGPCAFFIMGHAAMAAGILRASMGFHSTRWAPVRSDGHG